MNQIINVQNNNGELLVSSREVSKNFNKEHKNVKRNIRKLIGSNLSVSVMFFENMYMDSQNRIQTEYIMNRDGFSLLAMGFTGDKALEWKLKYIEVFNKMELELREKNRLQIQNIENRLENLENTMTIDYEQAQNLRSIVNSVCMAILGGKHSEGYKHKAKKLYSAIWRDYKDYFSVNSYKNTSRKDFDKAKAYLSDYKPNGKLLREIELLNTQK